MMLARQTSVNAHGSCYEIEIIPNGKQIYSAIKTLFLKVKKASIDHS